MKPPDWPTRSIRRTYGDLTVIIEIIRNFDNVLDFCAEHYPDDTDMIPYYADLWSSAEALSEWLTRNRQQVAGKTVIELGCGLGLPSIISAKLGANVTATDFHPHNRPLFERNCAANKVRIPYRRLHWNTPNIEDCFDLVIGSDLLYEAKQIKTLTQCAAHLLKHDGRFVLADPGRAHIQAATDAMQSLGFEHSIEIINETLIISFSAMNAGG